MTRKIYKYDGAWTENSRRILADLFGKQGDGQYEVTLKEVSYTKTRYKYYFDSLMREILDGGSRFYRIVNPATGEEREPRSTSELHVCMKAIYNPVVLITPYGATKVIAGTTTDLNDTEFIKQFQEQIIVDHSGPPFNLELTDYETWRNIKTNEIW